jgi:hypothetical protein
MALKISFSDGVIKEVSDAELARITERLKGVVSETFGKSRVREMISDGLELRRLGDVLETNIRGEERTRLEGTFYSLADKIRRESRELAERQELDARWVVNEPAWVAPAPLNPEIRTTSDSSAYWGEGPIPKGVRIHGAAVHRDASGRLLNGVHVKVKQGRVKPDPNSMSNDR